MSAGGRGAKAKRAMPKCLRHEFEDGFPKTIYDAEKLKDSKPQYIVEWFPLDILTMNVIFIMTLIDVENEEEPTGEIELTEIRCLVVVIIQWIKCHCAPSLTPSLATQNFFSVGGFLDIPTDCKGLGEYLPFTEFDWCLSWMVINFHAKLFDWGILLQTTNDSF